MSRSNDEIGGGIEAAREALAGGDVTAAAYLLGLPEADIARVAGQQPAAAEAVITLAQLAGQLRKFEQYRILNGAALAAEIFEGADEDG